MCPPQDTSLIFTQFASNLDIPYYQLLALPNDKLSVASHWQKKEWFCSSSHSFLRTYHLANRFCSSHSPVILLLSGSDIGGVQQPA